MHERERWQVIKAMLREQRSVRIADVCRATGASEASVRRDFVRLAAIGIRRHAFTAGLRRLPESLSARSAAPALAPRILRRSARRSNVVAKRAIARAAVDLCSDGDAIIVNGGTTTFRWANTCASAA